MDKIKDDEFEDRFPTRSTLDGPSSLSESVSPSLSPSFSDHSTPFTTENGEELGAGERNEKMKKLERKGTSFAYRVREHVKLGPKFSETVKGKLSVGAKIIKKGGRENIFRDIFGIGVSQGEKLLKASQCYLSTTAGPIAGILFISTHKICFCSERSIAVGVGGLIRIPYKVSIPVNKIKAANESGNLNNSSHKYIHIVTQDEFEFWFMGFLRYEKAVLNLQRAISMST